MDSIGVSTPSHLEVIAGGASNLNLEPDTSSPTSLANPATKPESDAGEIFRKLTDTTNQGRRDLLGFFLAEFVDILLCGGNEITPLINFSLAGAKRNLPNDADAVWAYLRLVDVALVHGCVESKDDLVAIKSQLREITSWTAGLSKGIGRVKSGSRCWESVNLYTKALMAALPGCRSQAHVELDAQNSLARWN